MKSSINYCGPLSLTSVNLLKEYDVFKRLSSSRHIHLTYKGRCGLGLLCQHWKLKTGDEVLMPAYNCGTEVDPFVSYGLNVNFYRIDKKARMDSEDLFRRVTEKTKVIYVIHYFGWPQDISGLPEYCTKNHIYLIEDCALSLFSNLIKHPIGVLGDAAIYSFPKTLPVPDGGALTMSGDILNQMPTQSPPLGKIFREMLPLIKRTVLRFSDKTAVFKYLPQRITRSRSSVVQAYSPAGLPEMPQSYYYDQRIEMMSASAITRYIVKHTSPEFVTEQRRANYTMLFEDVKDLPFLHPLYKYLPIGVCPLYLPVIVENREQVCKYLNNKGISAIQWWAGFHRAFDWAEFPEARFLKEHLLVLPIHQQLTPRYIRYIADQILKTPTIL